MADQPSTPKRKRGQMNVEAANLPSLSTTKFSFDPRTMLADNDVEDGRASPRSRVAHQFQGLFLEGGGGVHPRGSGSRSRSRGRSRTSRSRSRSRSPEQQHKKSSTSDRIAELRHSSSSPWRERDYQEDGARKRVRMSPTEIINAEDTAMANKSMHKCVRPKLVDDEDSGPETRQSIEQERKQVTFADDDMDEDISTDVKVDPAVIAQSESIANTGGITHNIPGQKPLPPLPTIGGQKSYPTRKRAGTPPLKTKTNPASSSPETATDDDDADRIVTDPVRASLTWHEDEITIYDPDDSDDDGTGINGIGFKPTPAIAYARTVKRKKQLAEYRKREEREARERRSLLRRQGRGSPAPGLAGIRKAEKRRVRFMESTSTQLIGA